MKLILAFLAFACGLCAETFVFAESYRTFKKDAFQTNVIWAQKGLNKKVGVFGWGQYGTTYRQAYGGLYLKPTSWLQVGAAGGAEQAKSKARLGTFAYATKSRYFIFAIYENGGSGYWYLTLTDVKLNNRWSVGTHSQAFIGHGLRAEYRFKPIRGWTPSIRPAVTWDRSSGLRPNAIVGLRLTYFKGE